MVVADDSTACRTASADAIVLAVDAADLARAQAHVEAVREESATPVILVVDLDRSGWDRTFASPEALNVDALFDRPVDAQALVRRLAGILAAREDARRLAAAPEMSSIVDRAIVNEEAAAAFYRRAAKRISDPETKEVSRIADARRTRAQAALGGVPQRRTAVAQRYGANDDPGGGVRRAAVQRGDWRPTMRCCWRRTRKGWPSSSTRTGQSLYPEGEERRLLLYLADVERGHKVRVEAMFANAAFPESW